MEELPEVGDKLGRFHLERKLGQGNLGIVFLANDTLLNIKLAIKVLNPFLSEGKAVERLSREVLLARKVSHPGVCRIFDLHQEANLLFITMEYIQGPTLEDLLIDRKVLPTDKSGKLASSIARALGAAHDQAVIHRGLTPKNIVIRKGERISILDFGLAKTRDFAGTTGASAPIEGLYYMAPEVVMAQPSTPQSDIYSLGAILYRCITGAMPFQGNNAVEVTNAVLAGRLVPPHLFNPNVTAPMEKVITKAMALKPEERYLSMREFREWLVVIQGGEPGRAEAGDDAMPLWHANIDMGVTDVSESRADTATQQIQMREKTILFSDIIGITHYFDGHGDMAGRKRIQKHNELLFPVIQKNNGSVLKTIGDAIMAYFDQPAHGVNAAMAMQRMLESANRLVSDEEDEIFIRIGLHTGPCIIENQDVFGDAVNVASRICSKADAREIMVSSDTRNQLPDSEQITRFHSDASLKGKAQDIKLYAVEWQKAPDALPVDKAKAGVPETATDMPAAQDIERTQVGGVGDVTQATEVGAVSAAAAAAQGEKAARDTLEMQSPFAGGLEPPDPTESPAPDPAAQASSAFAAPPPAPTTAPASQSEMDLAQAATLLPPPIVDDTSTATAPWPQSSPQSPEELLELQPQPQPQHQPRPRRMKPVTYVAIGAFAALVLVASAAMLIFMNKKGENRQPDPSPDETPVKPRNGTGPATGPAVVASSPDAGTARPDAGRLENPRRPGTGARNPDPKIRKTPVKPPVKPAVTAMAGLKAKSQKLASSLRTDMRKRGIITGDSSLLDGEIRKMNKARKKGHHKEALAAGKRAQSLLARIDINKAFIHAKLLRFNRFFDKHSDSAGADKVMGLAQDIVTAFESGKFDKANNLLNRSFRILRSTN